MSNAYLFPGQGSQFVGMCKDHAAESAGIKRKIAMADEILGYALSEIMFEGPAETLMQTEHTQPAIYIHSVALFEELDVVPDRVAGHSLGELSAIVAAGALTFEEGLQLVALRGKLMQQAGELEEGAMAAIIGMDDEVVELICEEAAAQAFKPVVAANYNSPGQVVISGSPKAVDLAVELAKGRGCRLAKRLPVSGAFHSPLMEPALKGFSGELGQASLVTPRCPVYSNYTAKPTSEPETIRENLLKQLVNPVRWTQSLRAMAEDGAVVFVEVGPGKVLQGLVKRTLDGVEVSGKQ